MAFTAGLALTACTESDRVKDVPSVYGPPTAIYPGSAEVEGEGLDSTDKETDSINNETDSINNETDSINNETDSTDKETEDMDNPARIPEVYGPPV